MDSYSSSVRRGKSRNIKGVEEGTIWYKENERMFLCHCRICFYENSAFYSSDTSVSTAGCLLISTLEIVFAKHKVFSDQK